MALWYVLILYSTTVTREPLNYHRFETCFLGKFPGANGLRILVARERSNVAGKYYFLRGYMSE